MGIAAIDIDFFHHGKIHAIIELAELRDVIIAFGVLSSKLVARKTEYDQSLARELRVKLLQALKLWRESTSTGGIDYQQYLVFVVCQMDGVASNIIGMEVVNALFVHTD